MIRGKNTTGRSSKLVWEEADILYLCANYGKIPSEDIARHFGVSAPTVGIKARELGLSSKLRGWHAHEWTEEELEYLIEHFPTEAGCDIADHLGLSAPCVCNKAKDLGLKKSKEYDRRSYIKRYVKNYRHVA